MISYKALVHVWFHLIVISMKAIKFSQLRMVGCSALHGHKCLVHQSSLQSDFAGNSFICDACYLIIRLAYNDKFRILANPLVLVSLNNGLFL